MMILRDQSIQTRQSNERLWETRAFLFFGSRHVGEVLFNWADWCQHRVMKKLYLKATLITAVVAIILAALFWTWSKNTLPQGVEKVTRMDEMETAGLPDFELPNMDGKPVKLSNFKGQVVIVSFWASWCAPCLDEFPSMIELVEKLKGQVKLVAVLQDSSREEIDAFLKSFPKSKHPDITILWDEKHTVGQKYDAERLPESFVAGKDLKLVRKIVGSINWSTPDAIQFMEDLTKK